MERSMINRLKIEFSIDKKQTLKVDSTMGSVLQGLMMTCIDREYGEILHERTLKPYSEYFAEEGGKYYWIINTLTDEAGQRIIDKMMEQNISKFYLEYRDSNLIVEKMLLTTHKLDSENTKRDVGYRFRTTTSFKKTGGEYELYPTVKYIFNSIINKYKKFVGDDKLSENLIDEIEKNVRVSAYNIRSSTYSIKGNKIPGFVGNMRFKIKGDEEFVMLVNELLEFSQYSGIGIKCAMGMGAVEVLK